MTQVQIRYIKANAKRAARNTNEAERDMKYVRNSEAAIY